MSGKYVLKKGESGKFHFNLLAGNGEIIATSQHYERKESAKAGHQVGAEQRRDRHDRGRDRGLASGLVTEQATVGHLGCPTVAALSALGVAGYWR